MITIIGAGSFGKALSKILDKNKHSLVDIEKDGNYSSESIDLIKKADRIIIAVPSDALINCLKMIKSYIPKKIPLLYCTKGLYEGIKTPTQLSKKYLPNKVSTLMGPNLSSEIMLEVPTITGIAGENTKDWIKLLSTKKFKPIKENNPTLIEFGGAVKNIIALGTGLLDGYYSKKGHNMMGSFVAFALKDIKHIIANKNDNLFNHFSFIGDLFTTCMSESSRNYKYGYNFGKNLRLGKRIGKPEKTVEGYQTLQIIYAHAVKHKLKLPTIIALHNIIFSNGKIDDIFESWK